MRPTRGPRKVPKVQSRSVAIDKDGLLSKFVIDNVTAVERQTKDAKQETETETGPLPENKHTWHRIKIHL